MNWEKILKYNFILLLIIFGLTYTGEDISTACVRSIAGKNPIGGRVVDLNPRCTHPVPHTSFATLQPNPGRGTGLWNDVRGQTFNFNYGPVNHLNQPVLGLAGYQYMPCLAPCTTGLCPIWHGGINAHYTGTGFAGGGAKAATGGCALKGAAAIGAVAGGVYLYKKHKKND